MIKQKPPQVTELLDSIVSASDGLHSFLPHDAHAHVSCSNHAHVVGSIASEFVKRIEKFGKILLQPDEK